MQDFLNIVTLYLYNMQNIMLLGAKEVFTMCEDEINKLIGVRLKNALKDRGLTLWELAQKVESSEGNVQRYEAGNIANVSIAVLLKFASALYVPPEQLLGWKNFTDNAALAPDEESLLSKYRRLDDRRLTHYRTSHNINCLINQYVLGHSVHDLRYTYATRLLAEGINIKTVASLLGDNIATVELIYVHYTDEMREKAAEDINRIFGQTCSLQGKTPRFTQESVAFLFDRFLTKTALQ